MHKHTPPLDRRAKTREKNKFRVHKEPKTRIKSMGSKNFLSMVKQMNLIAGNSSSGIIEAPSLKTPTINIGIRQKRRECAKSIFHCEANKKKLLNLIMKILYKKKNSFNYKNPYEKKYSSKNIISILENIKLEENLNKKFHDL